MKFLWKFYLADRKIILSQKFLGTSFFHSENLVLNITMIFQENNLLHPGRDDLAFKDTKNTGLLTFNYLKQKKLIIKFFVNCN